MARDPERIPRVLQALGNYWLRFPDLRLCQILGNMANQTAPGRDDVGYGAWPEPEPGPEPEPEVSGRVYNIEDDVVLAYLEAQMSRRK